MGFLGGGLKRGYWEGRGLPDVGPVGEDVLVEIPLGYLGDPVGDAKDACI